MQFPLKQLLSYSAISLIVACGDNQEKQAASADSTTVITGSGEYRDTTTLPPPFATESVKNFSKVIGWENGQSPKAPAGFTVTKFADKLQNPRWVYAAVNGDIFVAESATVVKGAKKVEAKFRERQLLRIWAAVLTGSRFFAMLIKMVYLKAGISISQGSISRLGY